MHTSPQAFTEQPQGGVRETVDVIWRRKWSILLVLALVLGASTAFALTRQTLYAATARVLVSGTGMAPGTDEPAEINLETEKGLGTSAQVVEEVAAALGIEDEFATLYEEIEVDAIAETEFLDFTYTSTNPETAAARANAFATAYLEVRREQILGLFESSSGTLQDRLLDLNRDLGDTNEELAAEDNEGERATLQARANSLLAQITILEQRLGTAPAAEDFQVGQIVEPAQVPLQPSSPNYPTIAALALVSGLALALGTAFLRERFDDRIRNIGDVEFAIQAPVLVTVPFVRGWQRKDEAILESLNDIDAPETEPYRALRTSVTYAANQRGISCMMVTSAHAGEGKSTVVANLAVALARAGRKVILVSGDLRRPRLDRIFPPKGEIGLTNVLAGEVEIFEALQPADFENLRVLHTGPIPGNPAELLGSNRMKTIIDELKEITDLVLFDAAPVIGLADALTLAPYVDSVLLVMDAQATRLGALSQTMHTLSSVSSDIMGGVLNKVQGARLGTYSTRYGYYPTIKPDQVVPRSTPAGQR